MTAKQLLQVWIDSSDISKLKHKAEAVGIEGRGCLPKYFSLIANANIVFVPDNLIEKIVSKQEKKCA